MTHLSELTHWIQHTYQTPATPVASDKPDKPDTLVTQDIPAAPTAQVHHVVLPVYA